MRVAVISDIHGNAHALDAVFRDVDRTGVDEIWCLGDVVGYGPRPNRCCAVVRERADISLRGNHDLACLGLLDVEDFSSDAAASARWTAAVLEPEAREFLEGLDSQAVRAGVELYHGSPRDPVWEYVLSEGIAAAAFAMTDSPLVLVGHSHIPLLLRLQEEAVDGGVAPGDTEAELAGGRWLLNPGSVGQPRDGDPRAAWLFLDLSAEVARFHRVAYPIEKAQAEFRERGLPEALAARLALGV